MSAPHATIDFDDVDALLAADRGGLLRSASMAGAQVRATAAALEEGLLDPVAADDPPRTVIWVAGRGNAETAGSLLSAALGGSAAAPIVVGSEAPPWIGALDVVVVAGDDSGDPALVGAAATAVRRGARVVVAAPYEGPLRDATAGRAAVLEPRLWVPDDFGLPRYLAAGLAVLHVVDPGLRMDLAALADELDAEALRNSAGRELFTNPAKTLADRMSGRTRRAGRLTARRRWRWPATAARSCCESLTRRWPRSAWPMRSSRCAQGWAGCRKPTARPPCSMTTRSTDRWPSGSAPSC